MNTYLNNMVKPCFQGSSKQRTRLRKRIANNKAKLKVFVDRYNGLVDEKGQVRVSLEDVEKGIFSWEISARGD